MRTLSLVCAKRISDSDTADLLAPATDSRISSLVKFPKALAERRCHVHHSGKPFLQIVDEFLLLNKHRWGEIETEAAGATGYRLSDRAIAADWTDFHRTHATLEIVSVEENLRAGASGYRHGFWPICAAGVNSAHDMCVSTKGVPLTLRKLLRGS